MTTPTTAAGRALNDRDLWEWLPEATQMSRARLEDHILAIEAEARAAALDEAYEAMKRLPHGRAYALAAIDALRERSGGKDSSLLAWGEHLIEERERNGE